jgi:carbamoyl-phosphate synthase small subunit
LGNAAGRRLAILDAGAARSLVAQLGDMGFGALESGVDIDRIKAAKAVGLIAAGGPGDPRAARGAAAAVKAALGKMPVLGVGLGHGLVALALGCKVSRMKVGHHGVNQSVRDLEANRCIITAQHHSFAVEAAVPSGVAVTHVNVNDGSVEGLRSRDARARGIQFQPGRDDMGAPSAILASFIEGRDA